MGSAVLNDTCCLLCEGRQLVPLDDWPVHRMQEAWQTGYGIDISGEIGTTDTIRLMECRRCGLRQFDPPGLAGSGGLYAQLQRFDWYYRQDKWEHRAALPFLKGCQRVLEVGCGEGAFLDRLSRYGVTQAEGIELNTAAVHAAVESGRHVTEQSLGELAAKEAGTRDGVCAFQVLEHVAEPGRFLTDCVRLLAPGGRLVIGVPNADSYLRHHFSLLDMPPHHVSRWTPAALAGLEDLFPLQLTRRRKEPLASWHAEDYVYGQWRGLVWWRFRPRPVLVRALASAVRISGIRRLLTGHSLLAIYEKTDAKPPVNAQVMEYAA